MAFQGDSIFWVEVEKIVPNPFQPRREFDEARLKELSESVRMYGILQPLTVTRREIQNEDGSFRSEYELIAGERRLRASKLAGLVQVPVIIREGEQSEQEKLELAIIENLQREDLNAVDRAIAFRQLADVFGLSHSQVAVKVGRSREYVSNSIRLLALPDYMLNSLKSGDISEGHARTLLMLNDRPEEQDTVFREVLLKKLSVREVERIARGIASEKIRKKGDFDADLIALEKKFTETLGTRVSITKTEFGGRLSIDYFTQEDLEEILAGMKRDARKMASVGTSLGRPPVVALGAMEGPHTNTAEELAILTERTGLELVPEVAMQARDDIKTDAGVPIIAVPDVDMIVPAVDSDPETEYFAVDNTPEVVDDFAHVYNADSSEVMQSEQISVEISDLDSQLNTNSALGQSTAGVVLEPTEQTQSVTTVSEESVPIPTPAPAPRSFLREQLASLLGGVNKQPAVSGSIITSAAVAPTMKSAEESVLPNLPIADAVTPVAAPASVSTETAADESELYSLRDFSI